MLLGAVWVKCEPPGREKSCTERLNWKDDDVPIVRYPRRVSSSSFSCLVFIYRWINEVLRNYSRLSIILIFVCLSTLAHLSLPFTESLKREWCKLFHLGLTHLLSTDQLPVLHEHLHTFGRYSLFLMMLKILGITVWIIYSLIQTYVYYAVKGFWMHFISFGVIEAENLRNWISL